MIISRQGHLREIEESEESMPQNRKSGARAVEYGLRTGSKIAQKLGARKVGNARSNEYELDGERFVIKCARLTTNSVGVPYHMLDRLANILGSFEIEDGIYEIYEMKPDIYRQYMRPTRSTGPSSGRVGIVRRSIFIDKGRFFRRINID